MSTAVQVRHLEKGANSAPERGFSSNLDIHMETVCWWERGGRSGTEHNDSLGVWGVIQLS